MNGKFAVNGEPPTDDLLHTKRWGASRFETEEELIKFRDEIWLKYTYKFGDFLFRWPTCEVFYKDRTYHLTEREADILKTLIDAWPMPLRPNKIILNMSIECDTQPKDFKVYIQRIRAKLHSPYIIITMRSGLGYQFNAQGLLKNQVKCL